MKLSARSTTGDYAVVERVLERLQGAAGAGAAAFCQAMTRDKRGICR
jgi:hypothetical protein